MIARRKLDLLLLASAIGGSRFFFRSHYLYDLDSVNFALALQRFDPRVHQPHPPGYYLYIWLGRALNWMVGDANLALVLLSILASCGVVVMIYILAAEWFGAQAARLAGALFVFSPLAWFHGIVALTYSVEAFFSAVLGYLCWQVESGSFGLIVPTGIVLGISAGIRQSSLLFLGPLFLFALRKVPAGRRIAGLAATAVTVPLWFIPMIRDSGGLERYFGALISLWRLVPATDTVFNSSPGTSIARAATIGFIYLLSFGAAAFIPLYALRRDYAVERSNWIFTMVWIAPALCFFTLIFLKFVNSGYLLLLVVPGCIWMGHWTADWYERSSWKSWWKLAVFAVCATVNVVIFLAAPLYCSYGSMRRFEGRLDDMRTVVSGLGSANEILLVGFDAHFLGYRHAGYYLPDYVTIEYPSVKLLEGQRIFAMQHRDTSLLTALPAGQYTRFVTGPLPEGDASSRAYVQKVKGSLPGEELHLVETKGLVYITGPMKALPELFPEIGR